MGTTTSPNLVITILSLSTGNPETGQTVELVPYGSVYPANKILLTEIGNTGRYKKETANGTAGVAQGSYQVYVGGTFRGIFIHGGVPFDAHKADTNNPHNVTASQASIVDSGNYYSGSSVESALQEIGNALASKASANSTILLDNSTQTVASGKPKVTNLNADKVDGKDVGTADGNIPEIGTGAGKLDSTVLNKKVGTANDNIPQISTDASPDAGKIHDSFLGIENSRRATVNDGDTPAPQEYGAGSIWVEATIGNNTTAQVLDNSIDWRDRLILLHGYVIKTVSPSSELPGGSSDNAIQFGFVNGSPNKMLSGGFYSEAGRTGAGNTPGYSYRVAAPDDYVFIWVDNVTGTLMAGKSNTTSGTEYALFFKAEYSPDQGHYA